jgi:hypothetical protein
MRRQHIPVKLNGFVRNGVGEFISIHGHGITTGGPKGAEGRPVTVELTKEVFNKLVLNVVPYNWLAELGLRKVD